MKAKKLVRELKTERKLTKIDIRDLKVKREAGVLQPHEFEYLQYNLELKDALDKVIDYYSPAIPG